MDLRIKLHEICPQKKRENVFIVTSQNTHKNCQTPIMEKDNQKIIVLCIMNSMINF